MIFKIVSVTPLNYGYTDNRQTNLATIGAGTITITKPETSAEGLNRDVTISQYNTYSGGLKGGVTVDTATVALIKDREKTLYNTVDALESGLTEAEKTAKKVDQEIETTIEKTENLLKFDHYTEDKNVSSFQTMDEYEKKVENGKPVSASETLAYYGSKNLVGEALSPDEQMDMLNAYKTVKQELSNSLSKDILDTYTKDTAVVINAKIALLKEIDPDAAHAIEVKFAKERVAIAYAKQLAVNSSLRDAEIQQGNEIANNVVNLSGTVNTMGIDNTDSNSPDAKLLRIVKDKLTENSIESIANAGNSDSTLKQAFNLALGVVFKEAADNIPEHISLGDATTASSGLVGREAKATGEIEKVIADGANDVAGSKSIWSSTKNKSSVENAYSHWEKHGDEFSDIQNSKQYVDKAKDFVNNPPDGSLFKVRTNGEIIIYHPETNTFGVKTSNGTPKTMFKPDNGVEYFNKQK